MRPNNRPLPASKLNNPEPLRNSSLNALCRGDKAHFSFFMTHLRIVGTDAPAPFIAIVFLCLTGCSRSADLAPTALNPANVKLVADAPANPKWGAQPDEGMALHPFVYKADKKLKSVAVVGTFNGWNATLNPMKVDADGLTWRLSLPLPPGRYDYKFAPDGAEYISDPNAPTDPEDPTYGNSMVQIVAQPFTYKSAKKLDKLQLVGSFNGWDKAKSSMVSDDGGFSWRLNVPLAPGRYVYKLAPFDAKGEQTWIVDPNAPRDETDTENQNSLLVVETPKTLLPLGGVVIDATAKAQTNEIAMGAGTTGQPSDVPHAFVFKADKPLRSVAVVGTFNGWKSKANPLKVDPDGLTWRLTLPLAPGRYLYKFAKFGQDTEDWVIDPNAPKDETDKVNDNSLLFIKPVGYDKPASPTDGVTATKALFHPHGARDLGYDNGQLALVLRARPDDLKSVAVKAAGQTYPAQLAGTDAYYAYYVANVPWNRKSDLTYQFDLTDGPKTTRFGAGGLAATSQPFTVSAQKYRPYLLSAPGLPLKMNGPLTTQTVAGPAWAKNLPIYEVNLDLYKYPKGTALREYTKQLPALKAMGVGIVWFMPLHPRGQEKGFGSPYAVRDYRDINPDFGTKADFKNLVASAHKIGLRVLMDWVPNHSSWDNAMLKTHPEFYAKDSKGAIVQAGTWADTAQLDYGRKGAWNQPLWDTMRDNMSYWVREFDIDGYRADVAGSGGRVPVEFWTWLRPQLDQIKPVFMLAEADDAYLHPAFDMTYSWKLPPVLWDISAGRKPATAIDEVLRDEATKFPDGAILMRFLDNHDWHGHADWGWGDGTPVEVKPGMPQVAPMMVLNATLPGKPLLYNGQELSFSKTDPSPMPNARTKSAVYPFYRNLLELYQNNPALVNGSFAKIATDNDDKVYAFTRQSGNNRVLVVVNLSEQPQTAALKNAPVAGQYRDGFTDVGVTLNASPTMKLEAFGYRVYVAR